MKQSRLAELERGVTLGDGDELVERRAVATLRKVKDDFLLDRNAHPVVHGSQLVTAVPALREMEERVLALRVRLLRVRDHRLQPTTGLRARPLGDVEHQ